ncbi:YciI family protein [Jannaschia sp. S6380]|uniref:YciI family protein n=1 Tax=Jannaschia sp. S6380 TaxID=2926408 RepID=UPI001FF58A86|nr:YciI family protein [Jannaschia sp. S6380]MCK0169020.1 YciI family protein [Jannaschia sp. S6380]
MLHALICTDKPDHLSVRKENREAHLEYLRADPLVIQAGPLIGPSGEMTGSLIVFDTDSRTHVEAFVAGDPYARAGLFADVRIETWNRVIDR